MNHILPLILLVNFQVNWVSAQPFQFNALTSETGLAHNTVFSIVQNYKEFMWFGTRDGLSRYNSQHIKNYAFAVHSPGVEANRINCLYAIGQELWVGIAVGLFRYSFTTDDFERVPLGTGYSENYTTRYSIY